MENIVTIHNNEGRAGTFLIAQGFNRRHEHVVRLVKRYRKEFEEINHLKWQKIKTKGRDLEECLLDEDQFLFLGTLFKNNDQVVKFKLRLVQEFKKCRRQLEQALNQKNDPLWNQARLTSKTLRLLETSTIKDFIAYAKEQGGTPAGCDMYYANFTNMTNALLFICEGKFKNMREVLTPEQLMTVGAAEQIINKGISDGMKNKMFYKDIYKDVKSRVMAFAELTGQSKVIEDCLLIE
jgi:phage regulator Rha-like protein